MLADKRGPTPNLDNLRTAQNALGTRKNPHPTQIPRGQQNQHTKPRRRGKGRNRASPRKYYLYCYKLTIFPRGGTSPGPGQVGGKRQEAESYPTVQSAYGIQC